MAAKKKLDNALIGGGRIDAPSETEVDKTPRALIPGQTGMERYEAHGENDVTELLRQAILYMHDLDELPERYEKRETQNLKIMGPLKVSALKVEGLDRTYKTIETVDEDGFKIGIEMPLKLVVNEKGERVFVETDPKNDYNLYAARMLDYILYRFCLAREKNDGKPVYNLRFPLSDLVKDGLYSNATKARKGFIDAQHELIKLAITGKAKEKHNKVPVSVDLVDTELLTDTEIMDEEMIEAIDPATRPIYQLFYDLHIDKEDKIHVIFLPAANWKFLAKYDMDRPKFIWQIRPKAYYFADEIFRIIRVRQTYEVANSGECRITLRTIHEVMKLPATDSKAVDAGRKDTELIRQPIWSAAEKIQRTFDENGYSDVEIKGVRRERSDGKPEYSGKDAVRLDEKYMEIPKPKIDDYLDHGFYVIEVRGALREKARGRLDSRNEITGNAAPEIGDAGND